MVGAVLIAGCCRGISNSHQLIESSAAANPRLSIADASAVVRAEIFREKPTMNPSAQFPLKELTTPEIWDRLHVQIFKITDGIQQDQAYIIRDRKASPLGNSFGGYGITSLCVADLAGDGHPQLLFSYSWGSGEHRSLVGLWTGGTSWIDAAPVFGDDDLSLEKIDDQHINVAYGNFTLPREFDRRGLYGKLRFSMEKSKPVLTIVHDAKPA
jgi:hypothetical protein